MKITILASLVILAFSEDSALDTKILVSIPQGELGKEISSIKLELAKIVASNLQIAKSVEREEKHYKALVAALQKNQVQVKEISAAPPSTSVSTPTSIPEQTPSVHSESLIPNRGTPGASSEIHPAKNGFSTSKGTSKGTWASKSGSQYFPASVWMRYSRSHRLAKIGFRTGPYSSENPKDFEVIGSNDCLNWNALLSVDNAGLTKEKQFKTWQIPLENRIAFSCLGLKIKKTNGKTLVRLGQITMWEQT